MLTYTIIDTITDAARDALLFASQDPVATWQDEWGTGRVYAVPVTVYAIVTRDDEQTELVGVCRDADEARELADEAAAAREEGPDIGAVATRLGVSREQAEEIVGAATRLLSQYDTVWIDPHTGTLHPRDCPERRLVAIAGGESRIVAEPEAARLIVEALDDRDEERER